MSAIVCPSCGAQVPAEHVNIVRFVAKCARCQSVFSFEPPAHASPTTPMLALPIAEVPLPPGVTVEHGAIPDVVDGYRVAPTREARLAITYNWFHPSGLALLFFALVWDAFLVFWYGVAFAGNAPWIMFVFPLIHVAVGVGITYSAVCTLFNKTRIVIAEGTLRVTHGPLPTRGNRVIAVEDVRQLYTTRQLGKKETTSYTLHAIVAEGPVVTLAKNLREEQQSLFIEQMVERHLGIPDQRVPGESRNP